MKPDRFYGDPVSRFNAMANARDRGSVDGAHFNMWCRVAADEISSLRVAFRVNMIRYVPNISHEQIDKFFANGNAGEWNKDGTE